MNSQLTRRDRSRSHRTSCSIYGHKEGYRPGLTGGRNGRDLPAVMSGGFKIDEGAGGHGERVGDVDISLGRGRIQLQNRDRGGPDKADDGVGDYVPLGHQVEHSGAEVPVTAGGGGKHRVQEVGNQKKRFLCGW